MAAPLSDLYGRKPVLDISFLLFTIWTIAAAVSPNVQALLIFRFLAGLGASSSLSVGGGIISDCFDEHERGGATAIFALGPVLGPVIGPLTGGYLADAMGWRWVNTPNISFRVWTADREQIFGVLSIFTGVTSCIQIAVNRESNPDVLARRNESSGSDRVYERIAQSLDWSAARRDEKDHTQDLLIAIALPWKVCRPTCTYISARAARQLIRLSQMMFSTPIVSLLCLYAAFVYGLLYLLLTTITQVFVEAYGWSLGKSGLAYLGLGVGFLIGVALVGGTANKLAAKTARNNGGVLVPEKRLRLCLWFSFLIPISFFWYGFTAAHDTHWALPICGLAPFAIGMIGVFLPIQTYLIDAAPKYAACSTAALASSRNVVGTFLPLAGPHLCKHTMRIMDAQC